MCVMPSAQLVLLYYLLLNQINSYLFISYGNNVAMSTAASYILPHVALCVTQMEHSDMTLLWYFCARI
jgi:hypothetical protein